MPRTVDLIQTFRPLFTHPHLQTIVAAKLTLAWEPPSTACLVALPDGDRIALEVSTPYRVAAQRPNRRDAPWPVWRSPFAIYAAPGLQAAALRDTGDTHEPARLWLGQRSRPLSVS